LVYLHKKTSADESFQLVKNFSLKKEIKNIKILNLAEWLDSL